MKKQFLILTSVLSLNLTAVAATNNSAMDILSLPSANRRMALSKISDHEYQSLIEIAFDEHQTMNNRWSALITAAEARPQSASEHLLRAAEHKEWYMRNAALVGLAQTQPLKVEQVAKKLLNDKALVVRSAAVEALKNSLTAETRELLWSGMSDSINFHRGQSLWIRSQILDLLAQKPMNHEGALFSRLLTDKDEKVSAASIAGLEKLTGVKLGDAKTTHAKLVTMWSQYLRSQNSASSLF